MKGDENKSLKKQLEDIKKENEILRSTLLEVL